MTGGREVVKSGGCMVPGAVDSSWADDTEDVEGNEDRVERSVSERHE